MILFLATAISAQLDSCADAVHGNLSSAVVACDPGDAKIDVMNPNGITDACLSVLKSGKQLGQIGPKLPDATRNSLIVRFDKNMNNCRNPKAEQKTPDRKITNLWD